MTSSHRLTLYILMAAIAGIATGHVCHTFIQSPSVQTQVSSSLSVLSDLFLRLISMIVAPLVFSTVASALAHMATGTSISRLGARVAICFLSCGLVALVLGAVMVDLLKPGVGANLPHLPSSSAEPGTTDLGPRSFITHLVPRSIIEALATNDILQIVVVALFVGGGIAALGTKGEGLRKGVGAVVDLMLQVTTSVMRLAPFAVFAALAAVVTTHGIAILATFGRYVGGFYLSLLIFWALLAGAGIAILGKQFGVLARAMRAPVLLAFATASSEAAYPTTLEQLERAGVSRDIASFVLPLGYSFNLGGSMMYCAFALLFIAQAYGVPLTAGKQVTLLLLLMVTSKGMAGVPRASLIIVAAALPRCGLPQTALLLVLSVDQFLDMGRTATNVMANSLSAGIVARWEEGAPSPQSRR